LGNRAGRLGSVVMGLGFVVVLCGLALPFVAWQLGNGLLE